VQLLAIEAIPGSESLDLTLHASLLGLELRELGIALGERAQILGYERAHGAALLGRSDPRGPVDVVRNRNRYIRHCVAQYHSNTALG
jgi:hypothetical protein